METSSKLLVWIPAIPLIAAAVNLVFARSIPRGLTHFFAVGSVAASFVIAVILIRPGIPLLFTDIEPGPLWAMWQSFQQGGLGDGGSTPGAMAGLTQSVFTWIEVGSLKIDLAFRLDTLSAVMVLVVTGVGLLIHIYSTGYMADEPRYAAYFGYLNLFTGSMLILVLADNLPVMFIGWEGVGLCSYLLIGFWFHNDAYAYAGRKAFVVNRIGDFAFLLGMFLLFWATGTLDLRELQSAASLVELEKTYSFIGNERLAMLAGLLLFIGACGKSAQLPLYAWLPDAMAGPTPVSALIHAATMVTAGVYLVARLSFLYMSSTTAMAVIAVVGVLTAIWAAIIAFAQRDIKKVLAYSTVSQLGFMFAAVGVGAHVAGIFHLVTHAFFKAGLFLAAGSVMHAMSGKTDIMHMGGLRRYLPVTHVTFLIFCIAIAGLPPLAGFFSKDEILTGVLAAQAEGWLPWFGNALWFVLMFAAFGTAFYMFRLYFLVFWGELRADDDVRRHIHESPRSMTLPLVILAFLAVTAGLLGLPHITIPGIGELPNYLEAWLAPALAEVAAQDLGSWKYGVMGIATFAAVTATYMAWLLYRDGPSIWVRQRVIASGAGDWLYEVVYTKKLYWELFFDWVARPFRWIAQTLFEVVDRFLIDLVFVNGSAFVVDVFGRVARWFQNGQVQRYLVALVVGGALLVFFATRSTIDIDYEVVGDGVVELRADFGSGLAGTPGVEVEWDTVGDGVPDTTEPSPRVDFGRPGTYTVTVWVTEPVFGKQAKATRTIVIPESSPEPADEGGAR